MSLKNEIFEGIAAYKALTPTAQDKYQGEMYKIAKRENDDYEEKIRNREAETAEAEARKAQAVGVPAPLQANIPTMSRSDTIGAGAPMPGYTDQAGNPVYNTAGGTRQPWDEKLPPGPTQALRQGGRVRRFAGGGFMGGLASGIKSTFQAPRAINVNQWAPQPAERDAGLWGSDDIAQSAAHRYGAAAVPPVVDYGSTGGTEGTSGAGGSATDGSGGSSAAGVGGDDGGTYRRGGRVRRRKAIRTHYRAGGAVTPQAEPDDDDDMATTEPVYRPGQDEPPETQREPYVPMPGERTQRELQDWPATDTYEEVEPQWMGREEPQQFQGRRSPRRAKAFDDGGVASAFRGGRPEYNPDEDPNVQERNRADAIIREIISAQVGEPNPANDPSLELRERGEADRARYRASIPPPPETDDPSAQITRRDRSTSNRLPPNVPLPGSEPPEGVVVPPKPAAPDRAGPTPAAATRAELDAKYRAVIPEPPEHPDPEMELRRDSDDAALSTGSATQPPGADTDDAYLSTGNARQDAEGNYRSQFPRPPQDQPISEEETQAIKLRTPMPPRSRYRDWAETGIDEDAANARANQEDWRKRERERKQTRGKASAERQKAEPGLFENLTPEEMRARREREAAAARVATSTEPPNIVYPQREEELRALETKVPPVPPVQPTQNLPGRPSVQPGRPDQYPELGPGVAVPAARAAPTERPAVPTVEATAGAGVQPPAAPGEQYGPPAPTPYGPPAPANPNAPATPAAPGEQYGPPAPSVGTNTPGGSPGATAAPPPGAADANRPSTAEKPDTRTAAYDPTIDRVDPATGRTLPRQLDAQGRAIATGTPPIAQGDGGPPGSPATGQITRTSSTQTYGDGAPGSLSSVTGFSNTDIAQTLTGASTLVRPSVNGGPPPVGHLAASRPAFNAYVNHHNQGGKLTAGEAMLVGMVSDYKTLLKQGRVKQANEMAYGLLQAANLEAASHGMVARDKMAAGDYRGAAESMITGLNYIADGVSQRISADGQSMESYDPRTGQVTARTPLDGRLILAGIMGLANGDLFWKTLQASAAHLQKPDTGAEGRQLSNELKRRQIALAEKRLNAPTGGRGRASAGTSGGMSGFQRDLARIRGEKVDTGGGGGGGGGTDTSYGDDLAVINLNAEPPE